MDAESSISPLEDDSPENMPTFKATWYSQSPCYLLNQLGGWLADQQNDVAGALQYYSAALTLDPTYSVAAFNGGKALMKAGDFEQAREWFLKSLESEPNNVPTFYKLSLCSFELRDYRSCISYADQCLSLRPQHAGAYAAKIRSYFKLKRWDEIVSRKDEIFPVNKHLVLFYVLSLVHLDRQEEARDIYEENAKRTSPTFDELIEIHFGERG